MNKEEYQSFVKKVWTIVAIVAFTVILLLLLEKTFGVFLLILGGALIALFFKGLGGQIQKRTGWSDVTSTLISVLGTILIATAVFGLIGSRIQNQVVELVEILPQTIENLHTRLTSTPLGQRLIDNASTEESTKGIEAFVGQFFQSTFGVLGDVYVMLFIGIFFTISPSIYVSGMIELIPSSGKRKAQEIFEKMGKQLRNWLKGTLFSMFIVFVLTAIGLALIGVPLWLVLAFFAGLISFIPNFGPLIGLIPAVLIALMQSTEMALLVVGLFILIQFIESNFITPLVQQKLINMPPALLIIAQLLLGALAGGWGLIFATPLTVIVILLIQELYIKKKTTESAL